MADDLDDFLQELGIAGSGGGQATTATTTAAAANDAGGDDDEFLDWLKPSASSTPANEEAPPKASPKQPERHQEVHQEQQTEHEFLFEGAASGGRTSPIEFGMPKADVVQALSTDAPAAGFIDESQVPEPREADDDLEIVKQAAEGSPIHVGKNLFDSSLGTTPFVAEEEPQLPSSAVAESVFDPMSDEGIAQAERETWAPLEARLGAAPSFVDETPLGEESQTSEPASTFTFEEEPAPAPSSSAEDEFVMADGSVADSTSPVAPVPSADVVQSVSLDAPDEEPPAPVFAKNEEEDTDFSVKKTEEPYPSGKRLFETSLHEHAGEVSMISEAPPTPPKPQPLNLPSFDEEEAWGDSVKVEMPEVAITGEQPPQPVEEQAEQGQQTEEPFEDQEPATRDAEITEAAAEAGLSDDESPPELPQQKPQETMADEDFGAFEAPKPADDTSNILPEEASTEFQELVEEPKPAVDTEEFTFEAPPVKEENPFNVESAEVEEAKPAIDNEEFTFEAPPVKEENPFNMEPAVIEEPKPAVDTEEFAFEAPPVKEENIFNVEPAVVEEPKPAADTEEFTFEAAPVKTENPFQMEATGDDEDFGEFGGEAVAQPGEEAGMFGDQEPPVATTGTGIFVAEEEFAPQSDVLASAAEDEFHVEAPAPVIPTGESEYFEEAAAPAAFSADDAFSMEEPTPIVASAEDDFTMEAAGQAISAAEDEFHMEVPAQAAPTEEEFSFEPSRAADQEFTFEAAKGEPTGEVEDTFDYGAQQGEPDLEFASSQANDLNATFEAPSSVDVSLPRKVDFEFASPPELSVDTTAPVMAPPPSSSVLAQSMISPSSVRPVPPAERFALWSAALKSFEKRKRGSVDEGGDGSTAEEDEEEEDEEEADSHSAVSPAVLQVLESISTNKFQGSRLVWPLRRVWDGSLGETGVGFTKPGSQMTERCGSLLRALFGYHDPELTMHLDAISRYRWSRSGLLFGFYGGDNPVLELWDLGIVKVTPGFETPQSGSMFFAFGICTARRAQLMQCTNEEDLEREFAIQNEWVRSSHEDASRWAIYASKVARETPRTFRQLLSQVELDLTALQGFPVYEERPASPADIPNQEGAPAEEQGLAGFEIGGDEDEEGGAINKPSPQQEDGKASLKSGGGRESLPSQGSATSATKNAATLFDNLAPSAANKTGSSWAKWKEMATKTAKQWQEKLAGPIDGPEPREDEKKKQPQRYIRLIVLDQNHLGAKLSLTKAGLTCVGFPESGAGAAMEKAGVQVGDLIHAINGATVLLLSPTVAETIAQKQEAPLFVTIGSLTPPRDVLNPERMKESKRMLLKALSEYYSRFSPSKVDRCEEILELYAGKERALLNGLYEKYGEMVPGDEWQRCDVCAQVSAEEIVDCLEHPDDKDHLLVDIRDIMERADTGYFASSILFGHQDVMDRLREAKRTYLIGSGRSRELCIADPIRAKAEARLDQERVKLIIDRLWAEGIRRVAVVNGGYAQVAKELAQRQVEVLVTSQGSGADFKLLDAYLKLDYEDARSVANFLTNHVAGGAPAKLKARSSSISSEKSDLLESGGPSLEGLVSSSRRGSLGSVASQSSRRASLETPLAGQLQTEEDESQQQQPGAPTAAAAQQMTSAQVAAAAAEATAKTAAAASASAKAAAAMLSSSWNKWATASKKS